MSRLSTDPKQLHELMGLNGVFPLISVFNMTGCIAIAFSFGWKLTLVTFFSALPVIFIAAFVRVKYELQFEEWNASVFAHSSQFATEAIGAFRTVTSLTMEDSIIKKYSELLQAQIRKATKKALYAALVFALSDSIDLCVLALTFWSVLFEPSSVISANNMSGMEANYWLLKSTILFSTSLFILQSYRVHKVPGSSSVLRQTLPRRLQLVTVC